MGSSLQVMVRKKFSKGFADLYIKTRVIAIQFKGIIYRGYYGIRNHPWLDFSFIDKKYPLIKKVYYYVIDFFD